MTPPAESRAWYRSLYWRIALGFILFLMGVLVAQGVLFLWVIARSPGERPSPRGLVAVAALDLSAVLAQNRALDIDRYLREEYGSGSWPLFVVMADGRVYQSQDGMAPPERLVTLARARLERNNRARGRGRRLRSPRLAPIVVDDRTVGVVAVAPASPLGLTLRQFGPTLIGVGLAILGLGTALTAFFIFRPARARLQGLEDAARRLGTGDLTARAPAEGGDEISAVARAFNAMAVDLRTQDAQVRASDGARRQLLADVSHELMTPLTAMRGYLETLSMPDLTLDAHTRERYLGIVGEETSRLEHIVGDLLDLARLEGGGGTLTTETVAIGDLFERVVARHERECQEKDVTMAISIGAGAETVGGDPHRLEQALQNLAANALRHTPAGGRVDLTAQREANVISLRVEDTGHGIPPEHLTHVFERFYKVEASRGGTPAGSGLGLSIVKAVVERHGGTIAAVARPGGGPTIEIRLPTATA